MILKRWAAGIMVLLFLLAAGCGGGEKAGESKGDVSPKKAASGEVTDVRNLLTKAEAEELMGEPVKEPDYKAEASNPMGQQLLFFSAEADTALRFIQISVVQNEGMSASLKSSGYNVTKLYQETKKMFKDNQPVTGIGDEAFWGTNGLHILYGNYYVNIGTGNSDKEENLELAKKVAAKVLPRL